MSNPNNFGFPRFPVEGGQPQEMAHEEERLARAHYSHPSGSRQPRLMTRREDARMDITPQNLGHSNPFEAEYAQGRANYSQSWGEWYPPPEAVAGSFRLSFNQPEGSSSSDMNTNTGDAHTSSYHSGQDPSLFRGLERFNAVDYSRGYGMAPELVPHTPADPRFIAYGHQGLVLPPYSPAEEALHISPSSTPYYNFQATPSTSSTSPSSPTRRPTRLIHCPYSWCTSTFTRPNDLSRHLATASSHRLDHEHESVEGSRICRKCGEEFSRTDARNRHELKNSCYKKRKKYN